MTPSSFHQSSTKEPRKVCHASHATGTVLHLYCFTQSCRRLCWCIHAWVSPKKRVCTLHHNAWYHGTIKAFLTKACCTTASTNRRSVYNKPSQKPCDMMCRCVPDLWSASRWALPSQQEKFKGLPLVMSPRRWTGWRSLCEWALLQPRLHALRRMSKSLLQECCCKAAWQLQTLAHLSQYACMSVLFVCQTQLCAPAWKP